MIPHKVSGAGNGSSAKNVFRVKFSEATSIPPQIEIYNNHYEFPLSDGSGYTSDGVIFDGTKKNLYKPLVSVISNTHGDRVSNWKPTTVMSGGKRSNRMIGLSSYVEEEQIVDKDTYIYFNICMEFPSDIDVITFDPSTIIQIRYQYSGQKPVLTFEFNEGTEQDPIWTEFIPGTNGIKYCNFGSTSSSLNLTLPNDGILDSPEVWVI